MKTTATAMATKTATRSVRWTTLSMPRHPMSTTDTTKSTGLAQTMPLCRNTTRWRPTRARSGQITISHDPTNLESSDQLTRRGTTFSYLWRIL
ncbi:hypothetical protein BV25DRAFT_458385 [Artomyces pyxidatus]|uniref:Uncharacterized protein n=1 Tax=Artomyces pyxidatus TaxID=48021 RepID=A0ACB8T4Y3_9AGAM|nr:hypothetical protein BV25DRAFT_458385 [Artomyces pyxidatus]